MCCYMSSLATCNWTGKEFKWNNTSVDISGWFRMVFWLHFTIWYHLRWLQALAKEILEAVFFMVQEFSPQQSHNQSTLLPRCITFQSFFFLKDMTYMFYAARDGSRNRVKWVPNMVLYTQLIIMNWVGEKGVF